MSNDLIKTLEYLVSLNDERMTVHDSAGKDLQCGIYQLASDTLERIADLEDECGKWRDIGRSTLDQLDHEMDSVIFIPQSHENTMRELMAALKENHNEQ
jgi:hypothetical protein